MKKKYSNIIVVILLVVSFLSLGYHFDAFEGFSINSFTPNKLNMNNNINVYQQNLYGNYETGEVYVYFKYSGRNDVIIKLEEVSFIKNSGSKCISKKVENMKGGHGAEVKFSNDDDGAVTFICDKLISGDVLIGNVEIPLIDANTKYKKTSSGILELFIE